MNTKKREEIFNSYVAKFKELGYDVYSPNRWPQYFYAFVTNGTHIIYFQINDWGIFEWSTCCIPSTKTGSGMRIGFEFTGKESVEKAFAIDYGKPYRDFNHFKENYTLRRGLNKL